MDPQRVKQLLADLAVTPPHEREGLLARATADSPELLHEVTRLLQLLETDPDFLNQQLWTEPASIEGQRLNGRYLLGAVLGRGGFSTVHRAQDEKLDHRSVAVKILDIGLFRHESARKEIQALARIDHPGVVGILDAGELEDGRWFLVRKLVEGKTLRELLFDQASLTEREVRTIALQLLHALDAVHSAGVLHLDIKPENIVLRNWGGEDLQAVLIDFGLGIASPTSGRGLAAECNVYQAPEVAEGHPNRSSDLYSMGIIIRELLGKSHRRNTRWTVLWERRYGSAREMLAALPKASAPSFQHVAVASVFVALISALLFIPAETRYLAKPFAVLSGAEQSPALSADAQRVYFVRATGTTFDIYAQNADGSLLQQVTRDPYRESNLQVSPDGRSLGYLRFVGKGVTELTVLDLRTHAQKVVARGLINSFSWGRSSEHMVVSMTTAENEKHFLSILAVDSGDFNRFFAETHQPWDDLHPALSDDGSRLAFVRKTGPSALTLMKIAVDGLLRAAGPVVPLHPHRLPDLIAPRWIEEGAALLFLSGDSANRKLYTVSADGGTPFVQPLSLGPLEWLDSARHGDTLVVAESLEDGNIWRLDLTRSLKVQASRPLIQGRGTDEEVALSPDGSRIAFVSIRSGSMEVWVARSDGSGEQFLWRGEGVDPQVYWISDQSVIVSQAFPQRRTLTEIGINGRILRNFDVHEPVVGLSRDRRSVFISGKEGLGVYRWSLQTGTRTQVWSGSARKIVEGPNGDLWICSKENEILRLVNGSATKVADSVQYRMFDVGKRGLYYVPQERPFRIVLDRLDGKPLTTLADLVNRPTFGFVVSSDEQSIYFAQFDQDGQDLAIIARKKIHWWNELINFNEHWATRSR